MNIEHFREFCLAMEGVTEKTPFGKFARRYDSILVFYVRGHMFCFIDIDNFTFVNVKSTPEEINEIRISYSSVSNPINQSLKHWIQLDFNGDISDNKIYSLVIRAYDIVNKKYSKKKQDIITHSPSHRHEKTNNIEIRTDLALQTDNELALTREHAQLATGTTNVVTRSAAPDTIEAVNPTESIRRIQPINECAVTPDNIEEIEQLGLDSCGD